MKSTDWQLKKLLITWRTSCDFWRAIENLSRATSKDYHGFQSALMKNKKFSPKTRRQGIISQKRRNESSSIAQNHKNFENSNFKFVFKKWKAFSAFPLNNWCEKTWNQMFLTTWRISCDFSSRHFFFFLNLFAIHP